MRKRKRELESWEVELLAKQQARRSELASLHAIAASRVYQPLVIRRRANTISSMAEGKQGTSNSINMRVSEQAQE